MIALKAPREIGYMRAAGEIVADTLRAVAAAAEPGIRLSDLDKLAAERIARAGATSSFLGYHPSWAPSPYPGVLCLSVNDVIVHGPPSGRRLQAGDLLSIDCAVSVSGYHADAAITVGVGEIDTASQRLADTACLALKAAIQAMVAGNRLGDVAHTVEVVSREAGYGIPTGWGGHGIGRAMHEEPHVPNIGQAGHGLALREGLVLAIEPMVIAGGHDENRRAKDGWSMVTSDGSRAAHWEHSVAITSNGPLVLTST